VSSLLTQNERMLLIDTCGDIAGVALACGQEVLAAEDLARGSASAEILQAIRRIFTQYGWRLRDLDAIGVVSGPGSFTGTRAGLATAKGLCEAAALPLAAVSRLEVLARVANLADGFAALDAGRNEVYVREASTSREWLCSTDELKQRCEGQPIAVADTPLRDRLKGCNTTLHFLHAADSLSAVLFKMREGVSDVALTDANYVRQESDIYRKPTGAIS
jgi:tRNA threonylcarbamoyladenosine biosynthesis protein TsaB